MDGVDPSTCQPEGALWTYNQGVILGAAAELYQATGDSTYLSRAGDIANAVTTPGSALTSSSGILTESCGTGCNAEADMFKGAFIRNFRKLLLVDNNSNWASFIKTNAQSIWNNDLNVANVNGLSECNTGPFWAGPYQAANEVTQGAALAALVAAISASS
jgi:predicted alpha-1,6-mannanase (GH76 family)